MSLRLVQTWVSAGCGVLTYLAARQDVTPRKKADNVLGDDGIAWS